MKYNNSATEIESEMYSKCYNSSVMLNNDDINEVKSLLTTCAYFGDMLLDAEYGKMNVAQTELVHKMKDAVQNSLTILA